MNFLQRIKDELLDPMNTRGMRGKVSVSVKELDSLIYHFEELDSYARAVHKETSKLHINEQLHRTIHAAYYQQGKNAEITLMIIMDALRPLMEERYEQQEIARFRHGTSYKSDKG